jgi:hypothetical protein
MTTKRTVQALIAALSLCVPAAALAQGTQAPACQPSDTATDMLEAADDALTPRNSLDPRRVIRVRAPICGAGRADLRLTHNDRGRVTVIRRARRTVDRTGTYTLRLRMTRAGRRFVRRQRRQGNRRVHLRLRASFVAASTAPTPAG